MAFTLSAKTTILGQVNGYYVTGTGNLTNLQSVLATIPAPFACTWNGNVLTITGGGTNHIIVIAGTLIENRFGNYSIQIINRAYVNWADSTYSASTTCSAASAGATSIVVASATNIVVGGYLQIGTLTTGGENNSRFYKVTAVSGTTITLNTGLASAVTASTTVKLTGSSTLGNKTSIGTYDSTVDIVYAGDSLPAYSLTTDPGALGNSLACMLGYGVLNGVSGSITIGNTNSRQDYEYYKFSFADLDNWQSSFMGTQAYHHHIFYAGNSGIRFTSKTMFSKVTGLAGGVTLNAGGPYVPNTIPPFACNSVLGLGFTSYTPDALPGGDYVVQKPLYYQIGVLWGLNPSGTGQVNIKVQDGAYYYCATIGFWNSANPSIEIFRTVTVNWKKPDATNVASASVPAKYVVIGGSAGTIGTTQDLTTTPRVLSFTGTSQGTLLRQSYKPRGAAYAAAGTGGSVSTGFVDDASYNIYMVSWGYALQHIGASAKPATAADISTDGIIYNDVSTQNSLAAAVDYASVVTAPFSFSTTGNGTLTISADCTVDQIGQYLLKLAYDDADQAFWRGINHSPANVAGGDMDIGAISVVVNSGVTVSEGAIATAFHTTGTVTNNGTIAAIYGVNGNYSTSLDFQNVPNGASVCIWDATTGTTELFQQNSSGSSATYTVYYPPGSAGTQKNVARELYGYQRESETITLAAGKMWVTYSEVQDIGITQTNQSTVAAYTTLETSEKVYDAVANFRLSQQGIKLGQIATRSGTSIDFGSYSGLVKSTSTSVLNITGSTITIKANGLTGTSKYNKIIATPPATWTANSTEIIDILIEDANGDSSVTIEASGVSTFEIWKITDATDPDNYATGTLLGTVGIGKFRFLHADGYKMVVRDTTTNFRVVSEMEKGDYEAALYFGADVQLAQAPDVTTIKNNLALMQIDVDAIKGTGFTKDKHSLTNIKKKAALAAALSA